MDNNIDITKKIKYGIKYDCDLDNNGVIEMPGKIITVNNSDGIYTLMNAKDIDWDFILDELKNINIEILNKYKYRNFLSNPENADKIPTYLDSNYRNDDKFIGAKEDDIVMEELKTMPNWYPNTKGQDGSINNTFELLDIINFLISRSIYLDKEVEDILNRFNKKTVKMIFSENVDSDQDGNPNEIITIQIKPVLELTDAEPINDSLYYTLTVSTLPGVNDSNFYINCTTSLDANVMNDSPVPVVVVVNDGKSISSEVVDENRIWKFTISLSGFNTSINNHISQLMFWSNTTMNTNAVDAKGFLINVKKTPNPIKSVIINKKEYIYFAAKELYEQIKDASSGLVINSENILYYPCLIDKKLLDQYSGEVNEDKPIIRSIVKDQITGENETKYVFRPSTSNEPGYLNWFILTNNIYAYPLNLDNGINFQFPCIYLENGVSNSIEIVMRYPTNNCVCKVHNYGADIENDFRGYYDKPYEYILHIPKDYNKTDSEILSIYNNKLHHTNFKYTIDYTDDAQYNGRFIFKLLSQDLDYGNIDKSFIAIFETTGTKYLETNIYANDGLKYVIGNPLALKFMLTDTEKLYVLPYSELTNSEKNENLYDLEDYPKVERPVNKDGILYELHDFLNNSKSITLKLEDGNEIDTYITPFNVNIPIISTKSFSNWQSLNDKSYKKSSIIISESNDITTDNYKKYLFNISNASNIVKDGEMYRFEDKNLILNKEIEIDYLATWQYINKFYSDYISSDIPMIDINGVSYIKDLYKNAKKDADKAKAIIQYFIEYVYVKNSYGEIIQTKLDCKNITSVEGKYYFDNLYSDKFKFFLPIVFKINAKTSGSSVLYNDTYFAMHLNIYRGKKELKLFTYKKNENDLFVPISLYTQDVIENYNNNTEKIKYSYIYSSKKTTFIDDEIGLLHVLCKSDNDDEQGPRLLLGNTIPESSNSNYLGGFTTNKIDLNYKVDENTSVVLSIDNTNNELYCKGFYTKYENFTEFDNDRWNLGKNKIINFPINGLITTDKIYYGDKLNIESSISKNKNLLPLKLNTGIFSRVTEGSDAYFGDAYDINFRDNNKFLFEKIISYYNNTMSFYINDIFVDNSNRETLINHFFNFNDDIDNNIYKTEIKCKFVQNNEDYKKFFNTINYENFKNLSNVSDFELDCKFDENNNKKILLNINNINKHLFNDSKTNDVDAINGNFYIAICIYFPQTPSYTGKYYYLRLQGGI